MLWYEYRQSNPGGYFQGPARNVFIQASRLEFANVLAEKLGIYFDGCSTGQDCSCCGDRWHSPYDAEEDKPEPYDQYVKSDNIINAIYVYNDGKSIDFIGVPANCDTQKVKKLLIEG